LDYYQTGVKNLQTMNVMNSKNHGIIVDCKNCNYISDNENSGIDFAAPIKDKETGIAGAAKLHSIISEKHHNIELKKWQGANHHPVQASEAFYAV
jgi:hypothetical protein